MVNYKSLLSSSRIIAEPNTALTPEISASIGAAFGTFLKNQGTITVARDFRPDSRMLKRAFVAGVMSAGVNIMDLTAAAIPVLQFAIRRFGTVGGAMFTSHHAHEGNKIELKLYNRSGIEYNNINTKKILEICEQDKIKRSKSEETGTFIQTLEINDLYERAILQFVDTSLFKNLDLHVVADCSNGPIGSIIPALLNRAGVDIIALHSSIPSISESLPNLGSLKKLSKVITATDATLGVCFDVDGSRAVFFDETGNFISSDIILTLFVKELLKAGAKTFITTETTTRILEKIINAVPNGKLIRVQNIPGNVANAIRIYQADFGGSDGGKFRFPEYAFFSDTALATLKILSIIAKSGKTLTEILADVPETLKTQYEILVSKEIFENFYEILNRALHVKVIDTLVGLKIFFGTELGWISVIPSFSEQKILLRGEIFNPGKGPELFKTIEYALEGKITTPSLK